VTVAEKTVDGERFIWRSCDECGADDWMLEVVDPDVFLQGFECPDCGSFTDTSRYVIRWGDPDAARDLWLEQ
jgi:hypothetical protein